MRYIIDYQDRRGVQQSTAHTTHDFAYERALAAVRANPASVIHMMAIDDNELVGQVTFERGTYIATKTEGRMR